MSSSGPSFFPPSSELGVLEAHVRRLQASAHAPPLDRAEQVLADIRGAVLRTHEAQLQVSIATSAGQGFEEHKRTWQAKINNIERSVADRTSALRGIVEELRVATFQRFAASLVIGTVVLRWLFDPPGDGRPPPVLRAYIQDCAFISPGCAKSGE